MAQAPVSVTPPAGPRLHLAVWLGRLGGVALGLVLLFAVVAKALDPAAFAEELAGLGFAGGLLPAWVAALGALALEAVLGALLLLDLRRTPVLIAATLLVAFFLTLTGREAWRAAHGVAGAGSACGCFGNLVERTPAEAFRQDLLLLVPALALAWLGRPGARRFASARVAAAAAITLALTAFAAISPRIPIDDLATRLKPGVALADLCAGSGAQRVCLPTLAGELAQGTHLVVIADVNAAGFEALGKRLNAWTRAGHEPPVAVLGEVTPERASELFWSLAPAFELHDAPRALLRPLYRSLPRSFRVEDGRVTATWTGLPPALAAGGTTNAPEG
jgi:hypothetical protein